MSRALLGLCWLSGAIACSSNEDPEGPVCPAAHVLAGGSLDAAGLEHAGDLAADEIWRAADSPHVVSDWVVVDGGRRLEIEACAVVVFAQGAGLRVGSGWGAGGGSTPGDLLAVGDAEQPILFTGASRQPGAWARLEFHHTTGTSRLAYATVENAGSDVDGDGGASLALLGPDVSAPAPLLQVEHVRLRDGVGVGLLLDGGAELAAGSEDLRIVGMSGHPVRAAAVTARSLPEGDYTGNGDDRIHLMSEGAVAAGEVGEVVWRNLGLPYLYEIGTYQNWHCAWSLEPGLEIFVKNDQDPDLGLTDNGVIGLACGGAIDADGGSAEGLITFRGEGGRSWGGFSFWREDGVADCPAPALSRLAFVRLLDAGTQDSCNGDDLCVDLDTCRAAITLNGPYLELEHSEIHGIGDDVYAIARNYCGWGDEGLAAAALGNRFFGPMHCPQTDQNECEPAGGACYEETSCCQHDRVCYGEVE